MWLRVTDPVPLLFAAYSSHLTLLREHANRKADYYNIHLLLNEVEAVQARFHGWVGEKDLTSNSTCSPSEGVYCY